MNKPRKKGKIFILIVSVLLGISAGAQDVTFSQFYSNPLFLNPAFAGSLGVPRLAMQYRNQWPAFGNAFRTATAAIDFPVEKLQGGVGFYILSDTQASGSFQSLQLNGTYSVYVQLNEEYRMHGAVQATFGQLSLNMDQLIFHDNLDVFYGNHGISGELEFFPESRFNYIDFSTGVLLYGQKYFGGLVVHHLAEPRLSFLTDGEEPARISRKYTAHFGARLPVSLHGSHRKKIDLSPQLVTQYQNGYGQINYGFFASFGGLTAGSWFRQNLGLQYDALVLLAGFTGRRWQITYSHDIAVSGLWGDTGGTSEISLVFLLKAIKREDYLPFYDQYDDGFGFQ